MLLLRRYSKFALPSTYRPNTRVVDDLPFKDCLKIWANSLRAGRLAELQHQLVELMISSKHPENSGFSRASRQVPLGNGHHINEVTLLVTNNESAPTKHLVFVHGYGASLGCFARNFQIINQLKGLRDNYTVHFLDNISFGLSSNPKIESDLINHWNIDKTPSLTLHDLQPTDPKKLYNKYYKLIDSYDINKKEFSQYQQKFKTVLPQIEHYYLDALDKWRQASKIDKIDFLVGHSFGGYWLASYALKYPGLRHLILLSPVGVERHVHAIDNSLQGGQDKGATLSFRPTLDPESHNFLSRWPILSKEHIKNWYDYQPYLPRLLKFFGPFGVLKYYKMWYLKLFKINRLIHKRGGARSTFTSNNDLVYGTNKECLLIIEYLYNSITNGTHSDTYVKYLLTPSTVSKWPLYDKFVNSQSFRDSQHPLRIHFLYGQYDFMNSEAGLKLSHKINEIKNNNEYSTFAKVSEGGHNLYIDNPFEVNDKIVAIVKEDEAATKKLRI